MFHSIWSLHIWRTLGYDNTTCKLTHHSSYIYIYIYIYIDTHTHTHTRKHTHFALINIKHKVHHLKTKLDTLIIQNNNYLYILNCDDNKA